MSRLYLVTATVQLVIDAELEYQAKEIAKACLNPVYPSTMLHELHRVMIEGVEEVTDV